MEHRTAIPRLTILLGLMAFGAHSQGFRGTTVGFDLRADPPSPPLHLHQGSSGRGSYGYTDGELLTHRYFYDEVDRIYFGYDIGLVFNAQNTSQRLTFYELGMGVQEVAPIVQRGDVSEWKRLPVPVLPAPRDVESGDAITVDLGVYAKTGQKLVDTIHIQLARTDTAVHDDCRAVIGGRAGYPKRRGDSLRVRRGEGLRT